MYIREKYEVSHKNWTLGFPSRSPFYLVFEYLKGEKENMKWRNTPDLRSPFAPLAHWCFFPFLFFCFLLPLLARSGISLSLSSPSQTLSRNTEHGSVSEYFLTAQRTCWLPCMEKFGFPSSLVLWFFTFVFQAVPHLRPNVPSQAWSWGQAHQEMSREPVACERKPLSFCSPELWVLGRCSKNPTPTSPRCCPVPTPSSLRLVGSSVTFECWGKKTNTGIAG